MIFQRDRNKGYYLDCMIEEDNNPHEAEQSEITSAMPEVIVSFSGYKPPFNPEPMVKRMLDSVPRKYLVGLKCVVLTNTSGLSRRRRKASFNSRKRKYKLDQVRGLYHPAYRRNPAWIEIFVDKSLRSCERGWWRIIPYLGDQLLSEVLFHEIGHHIHYTVRPEYREKEDVADIWKVRLFVEYDKQRFRWIRTLRWIIRPVYQVFRRPLDRLWEKFMAQQFKDGHISRAEYMEEIKGYRKAPSSD